MRERRSAAYKPLVFTSIRLKRNELVTGLGGDTKQNIRVITNGFSSNEKKKKKNPREVPGSPGQLAAVRLIKGGRLVIGGVLGEESLSLLCHRGSFSFDSVKRAGSYSLYVCIAHLYLYRPSSLSSPVPFLVCATFTWRFFILLSISSFFFSFTFLYFFFFFFSPLCTHTEPLFSLRASFL